MYLSGSSDAAVIAWGYSLLLAEVLHLRMRFPSHTLVSFIISGVKLQNHMWDYKIVLSGFCKHIVVISLPFFSLVHFYPDPFSDFWILSHCAKWPQNVSSLLQIFTELITAILKCHSFQSSCSMIPQCHWLCDSENEMQHSFSTSACTHIQTVLKS